MSGDVLKLLGGGMNVQGGCAAAQAFVQASRLCEEVEGFVLVMEHVGGGMAEG